MDRAVFARLDALEDRHWWFTARRSILATLIEPLLKDVSDPTILEAGCGSGGNLGMLRGFGKVDAFEFDEMARNAAITKSGMDIAFGALPNAVPYAQRRYDLIGLFDVLEHVEQDTQSLATLARRLKEDGKVVVTVPAFPFMWSKHDERHHHFRRYTRNSLNAVARDAGLKSVESHYFNSLLFPAAIASRGVKMLTGSDKPDDQLPADGINRALTKVFGFERKLIRRIRMPFGLSLAAVFEKA